VHVIDGTTYPAFQTWQLNMLMEWAKNDPVSEKETARNEAVYAIQKNRNPFVDYPGLEQYVWGDYKDVSFSYDNYAEPPATAIPTVRRAAASASDGLYDLKGRRVGTSTPKKGVYIRRGRKVVIQ
jgi:hypothetical protein